MRALVAVLVAGLLGVPAGLALSSPAASRAAVGPVGLAAEARPEAGDAFPNCPAPAVSGMNIRLVRRPEGAALTVHVIVQNVGARAFYDVGGGAQLSVRIGGREMGRFALNRLTAGEVRLFSVAQALPADRPDGDVSASLTFAAPDRIGRVDGTLDCQISDNQVTRRNVDIR